jgi:hypothetical protein
MPRGIKRTEEIGPAMAHISGFVWQNGGQEHRLRSTEAAGMLIASGVWGLVCRRERDQSLIRLWKPDADGIEYVFLENPMMLSCRRMRRKC